MKPSDIDNLLNSQPLNDGVQMTVGGSESVVWQEGTSRIIITPIKSYDENKPFLTEAEKRHLEAFENAHRRDEGSTWRAALRRHTGCGETGYDSSGAPFVSDNQLCISVSHSPEMAAIMISDLKCGIDIERCERNFSRAASRYMSREEAEIRNDFGSLWAGVVWCAKECLYKLCGHAGIDFRHDMQILSANGNTLICSLYNPSDAAESATDAADRAAVTITLNVLIVSGHICVWGNSH